MFGNHYQQFLFIYLFLISERKIYFVCLVIYWFQNMMFLKIYLFIFNY